MKIQSWLNFGENEGELEAKESLDTNEDNDNETGRDESQMPSASGVSGSSASGSQSHS